jgi:hypothetical protein
MGVPKLRLLLSQNFVHSYLFEKSMFRACEAIFYSIQKDLSNGVLHSRIKDHLTLTLKGFVIGS